ncbi:MAG: biotin--[acetyl-CoA-carboxylase] ligase [Clostridia bacterium]
MRVDILQLIEENKEISGEYIGKQFEISRSAVGKYITKLKEKGVAISSSKKGYTYTKTDCLCEETLTLQLLKNDIILPCVVEECDSTNTLAKSMLQTNKNDFLLVAPRQLNGRGRLERKFVSDVGGVYMSYCYHPTNLTVFDSVKLVLLCGVAVMQALKKFNVDALLKWPNDVLVGGKKICGILLESVLNCERVDSVVFGIGVNVNNSLTEVEDIATSICKINNCNVNRADVAVEIVKNLQNLLKTYENEGFESIKQVYLQNSCTIGKNVKIKNNGQIIEGVAEKLSAEGFLILNTKNGETKIITGDIINQ